MSLRALCLSCLLLVACRGGADVAVAQDGWELYGAELQTTEAVALSTVLGDAGTYEGQTLLVEATIDECCLVKGCWMTFVEGGETVRVTFQDYAFFVPLNSAGRTARVEGRFRIREVPVDEARHYLEDAGRHDEAQAITEPQRTYEIVATGVRLRADA